MGGCLIDSFLLCSLSHGMKGEQYGGYVTCSVAVGVVPVIATTGVSMVSAWEMRSELAATTWSIVAEWIVEMKMVKIVVIWIVVESIVAAW